VSSAGLDSRHADPVRSLIEKLIEIFGKSEIVPKSEVTTEGDSGRLERKAICLVTRQPSQPVDGILRVDEQRERERERARSGE
jgi:hypothetical protein